MNYVEKVINIAKAEIGYVEKASNKDLDSKTANAGNKNYNKYARDLDALGNFYNGKKNGYDWCDIFVDWCFVQAYGVEEAKKLLCQPNKSLGAGCKYSMQYYEKKGQLKTEAAVGDQIFFKNTSTGGISHTGIVFDVDNTYVYTIEGNSTSTSNKVAQFRYKKNANYIAGYGRPAYDVKKADYLKVGDLVYFSGTTHYSNASALFGKKCTKGLARITAMYNGKHPYHIVGTNDGSNVYGWVNASDITKDLPKEDYQCIHTVVKGENLSKLAIKYLGKWSRYPEIMKLNGKTTTIIKIGEKLKIPNK